MELIYKAELINSLELLAKFEDTIRASVILGVVETVKRQKTIDAVSTADLEKIKEERDAAIKDLRAISSCPTCKAFYKNSKEQCMNCSISNSKWEWFRTIS